MNAHIKMEENFEMIKNINLTPVKLTKPLPELVSKVFIIIYT